MLQQEGRIDIQILGIKGCTKLSASMHLDIYIYLPVHIHIYKLYGGYVTPHTPSQINTQHTNIRY